jgi:hypothetical protein
LMFCLDNGIKYRLLLQIKLQPLITSFQLIGLL